MKKIFLLFFYLLVFYTNPAWAAGETPVMFQDMLGELDTSKSRPWTPPKYGEQKDLIGYKKDTFKVPPWLQPRVSFWIDIYTKFTTDQGLLHDSRHVNIVYESVDFTDIMKNEKLSLRQKRRARKKKVKEAKLSIKQRLRKLQKIKSADGLEGEDLRYWHMFSKVEGRNKFINAGHRKRLRFQLGQKDRFIKGIFYSGRYLNEMEQIFAGRSLPKELTRLPFVESSFNDQARSRVGASGIWQFMRYTAKRFMRMSSAVDERNDPIRATVGAARLLKINYEMLGSWDLAITGYNHGPAGVRRMLKKHNATTLEELIDKRKRRFGFASANFYASFLAAVEVEKKAKKHFGQVLWDKEIIGKKLKLTKRINKKTLVKWFSGDVKTAKLYNIHLRRYFWKGWYTLTTRDYVRLPEKNYKVALEDLKKMKNQLGNFKGTKTYRIARGDTLSDIAREFGISIRLLKDVNGISNPRRIRAGQKLIIPQRK